MTWLQHLRVSTKLLVIALLFAVPVALLGYLFVQQSRKDILFAERELDGTRYLKALWPPYRAAILVRAPTAPETATFEAAAARFDPAMDSAAAHRAFVAAPPGDTRIEMGQTLIQKVADGSALTLDPDLDSYYLMDFTTLKVPELLAASEALMPMLARLDAAGGTAPAMRANLSFALGRVARDAAALNSSFDSAASGNPDGSVRRRLSPLVGRTTQAADAMIAQARAISETVERGGAVDRAALARLATTQSRLEGDLDRLWSASLDDLERLLHRRIDGFEHRLYSNLGVTLLLLLAVIAMMVAVSRSITYRLNGVAAAMNAMRGGSLERRVPHQGGRDEIGTIAQTLEVFRSRLISLRAFEGDLIVQEANKAADLRFKDMLEISPIGVVIDDRDGRTRYSNRRFAEILGMDVGAVLTSDNGSAHVDPAQRTRYLAELTQKGRVSSMEVAFRKPDGGVAVCLLSGENTEYDGEPALLTWVYDVTGLKAAEAEIRSTQTRLVQSEKLASLGQLTAGIAHEIKNPLNFVNNFSEVSKELVVDLVDVLEPVAIDTEVRAEVEEIAAMLTANLDKVVQHGRRADSIVKNMLLHSREDGGERRVVDFNATVEESLNLAYHGARAEKKDFNATLRKDLDPAIGPVLLYPQEFTRVLLNLISNGFYAAHKRRQEQDEAGFQPTMAIATRAHADRYEVRIRDNGTGIPDAVRAKIFNPFFTTKPPGEGTGLGLSLSHDIIVQQHGGTIDVDTRAGEYTEFVVTIPRT